MKINTKTIIFLILLISVYLCFMVFLNPKLEINEHFLNPYIDNQLKDSMLKSINDLKNIKMYKSVDIDSITDKMRTSLNIDSSQVNLYNQNSAKLDTNISKLRDEIKNLKSKDLLQKNQTITKYRSIRSNGNSQPINIAPLSNDKYLLSLNGKCLESDGLLRTTIKPCNSQNPNQYFTVNMVVNDTDYNNFVYSDPNDQRKIPFKYPFHIIKSDSGNCLINNNGGVSIIPCKQDGNQQWQATDEPADCY
jgi:hypothetical protein